MSPIRTEQCSEGFHQANEASDGATETSGSALSHLAQHINMLELMGGYFAAKIDARDKQDIHIHLRMDNTTAIAYISHVGGTKSHNLSQAACSLWQWCLQSGITLSAEHLPGTSNTVADVESRTIRTIVQQSGCWTDQCAAVCYDDGAHAR